MKITSSNLSLNQSTQKQQTAARVTDSSVTVLQGNANNTNNNLGGNVASIRQSQDMERLVLINSVNQSFIKHADGSIETIQNTQAIESITQLALEQHITIRALSTTEQNANTAVNVEINRMFAFESNTSIQMSSQGKVTTEDGREIDFLLELNYQSEMQITQTSQFNGNRNLIDPLVINLTGGPAQLSDSYFEFDLNGDGNKETLHQTATGTGFLVFDKNGNGIIDDGSEMFGPETGYGFAELSTYDEDGNGWIDENDSIFAQLSFMDFNQDGEQQLQDLATVGLGAIALQTAEMDFDLYDSQGNFQANVARSSVALMENGSAVSIQEIYYADQASEQGQLARTNTIDVDGNGVITQNISPLTQFQFDNTIINNRNEDTAVTLDSPNDSNRGESGRFNNVTVSMSSIEENLESSASLSDSTSDIQAPNTVTAESSDKIENKNNDQTSRLNKRADIQNYFQNKIQSQSNDLRASSTPASQENTSRFHVDDLTQSVNWDFSQSFFSDDNNNDKKLEDLKLLVENLKVIRERQIKLQEKLGIYQQVGSTEI